MDKVQDELLLMEGTEEQESLEVQVLRGRTSPHVATSCDPLVAAP